jgi:hypothetical protein
MLGSSLAVKDYKRKYLRQIWTIYLICHHQILNSNHTIDSDNDTNSIFDSYFAIYYE